MINVHLWYTNWYNFPRAQICCVRFTGSLKQTHLFTAQGVWERACGIPQPWNECLLETLCGLNLKTMCCFSSWCSYSWYCPKGIFLVYIRAFLVYIRPPSLLGLHQTTDPHQPAIPAFLLGLHSKTGTFSLSTDVAVFFCHFLFLFQISSICSFFNDFQFLCIYLLEHEADHPASYSPQQSSPISPIPHLLISL